MFIKASDENEKSVYKWNGISWSFEDVKMGGAISSFAAYKGNLFAGGFFHSINNIQANFIAERKDKRWVAVGPPTMPGYNNMQTAIRAMLVYKDLLYVGGNFKLLGNQHVNGIATWDGNTWSTLGKGISGSVNAIAIFNDEIYAGGSFKNVGDEVVNGITKWSSK